MIRCTPEMVSMVCRGLDHPECINATSEGAIMAGGEAGQIYHIDATGTAAIVANTGGFILGVCSDSEGSVFACDCSRNQVLRIGAGGRVAIYSSGGLDTPNYCAFDRAGNLFFTTSGEYFHATGTGKLFVVTPERETRCIHPGPFRFANGIAIDDEESMLYLVESVAPQVAVFELDGPGLQRNSPVRTFPLEPGTVPDGIALDVERNVYVGYYAPDQIGVIHRNGQAEVLYRDVTGELLNRPTNLMLRRDEIYFANLGGYHIGRIDHRLDPLEVVRPLLPAWEPNDANS